jgi:hypothetical protein
MRWRGERGSLQPPSARGAPSGARPNCEITGGPVRYRRSVSGHDVDDCLRPPQPRSSAITGRHGLGRSRVALRRHRLAHSQRSQRRQDAVGGRGRIVGTTVTPGFGKFDQAKALQIPSSPGLRPVRHTMATPPTADVRDIGTVSTTVVALTDDGWVELSDFPYDPFGAAAS